jgi:hypothetical protein
MESLNPLMIFSKWIHTYRRINVGYKRQIDKEDNTIYQGTTAASGLAIATITAIGGETN